MDRRTFVGTLTIALLAAPLVARAQQAQKTVHIGVMSSGQTRSSPLYEAFDSKNQKGSPEAALSVLS